MPATLGGPGCDFKWCQGRLRKIPALFFAARSIATAPDPSSISIPPMSEPLDIPRVVRNKADIAGASDWLDRLPSLVSQLCSEWSIRLTGSLQGATEAFVAGAELVDGTAAVLKVLIPRQHDAAAHEIEVLQLVDGDGCPRLLRADADRGAMLMERLGPSLDSVGLPIDRRHRILCAAARRIWRPVQTDLPSGADKGRWLIELILEKWETTGRQIQPEVVDHAIGCARRRIDAHDSSRAVLVHGDVHQWNALSDGECFKLIDPDGLVAEPEYDLGIIMREDPVELMDEGHYERAARLASISGLDARAIWEWGVVERVSTGLILTEIGLQPVGSRMLDAAEYVFGST